MGELSKEIWIDAPPEHVYPYIVQPELATTWMGDESWNDPRPGGVFRLNIRGHVTSGEFVQHAQTRGGRHPRLLSSARSSYRRDYNAESDDGAPLPIASVFVRREGTIHHFWSSELFGARTEPVEDPRHVEFMWPVWATLDRTPEGRGTDWRPKLEYR